MPEQRRDDPADDGREDPEPRFGHEVVGDRSQVPSPLVDDPALVAPAPLHPRGGLLVEALPVARRARCARAWRSMGTTPTQQQPAVEHDLPGRRDRRRRPATDCRWAGWVMRTSGRSSAFTPAMVDTTAHTSGAGAPNRVRNESSTVATPVRTVEESGQHGRPRPARARCCAGDRASRAAAADGGCALGQLGAQELLGDELVGFDGRELGHQRRWRRARRGSARGSGRSTIGCGHRGPWWRTSFVVTIDEGEGRPTLPARV